MKKRINKILWYGDELKDGKAKEPAVSVNADGLDGLNEGELYIANNEEDPAIFIRTSSGKVARIGSDKLFSLVQDEEGNYYIHTPYALASDSAISSLGKGSSGDGSGSGVGALYQLVDVLPDGDKVSGAEEGNVLMYDATQKKWYGKKVDIPDVDFSEVEGQLVELESLVKALQNKDTETDASIAALQETDVQHGEDIAANADAIATLQTDLKGASDALATLEGEHDALAETVNDFLTGVDVDDTINRWKELEKFLAGYSETSTLADLLSVKADKSVVDALSGTVTSEVARLDELIGGHATRIGALETLTAGHTTSISTINNTLTTHKGLIDKNATNIATNATNITKNATAITELREYFDSLFSPVYKEDGTIEYIHTPYSLASDGALSSLGKGTSEGGSGVSYSRLDAWDAYDADAGAVLSATLGYDLHTRLGKIESGDIGDISLSNYYTKSEVYNKQEVDASLAKKQDVISDLATIRSGAALGATSIQNTHVVNGITQQDITNWNNAFGWGDHATNGYLVSSDLDGYVNNILTNGSGNAITSVSKDGKVLTFTKGSTFFLTANFNKTNIKTTLGISDWALASTKPSYKTSEVTEDTNLYFTNARAIAALKSVTDALSARIKKYEDVLEVVDDTTGKYLHALISLASDGAVSSLGASSSSSGTGSLISLTEVASNITPVTDDYYNIGSSSLRFSDAYINNGYFDYIEVNSLDVTRSLTVGGESVATQNELSSAINSLGDLAYKDSIAFSEITSKPTTLSGYGITDALHAGNYTSYTYSQSTIDSKIANGSVAYATRAGSANELGGHSEAYYMRGIYDGTSSINSTFGFTENRPFIVRLGSNTQTDYPTETNDGGYGVIAHFCYVGSDTAFQLYSAYSKDRLLYRRGIWRANGSGSLHSNAWKTVAFTDSDITGNAATATKLAEKVTIWGQSFDGSANVDGPFYFNGKGIIHDDGQSYIIFGRAGGASYIRGSEVYMQYGTKIGFTLNSSGNVTIGSSDLAGTSCKMLVDGIFKVVEQTQRRLYSRISSANVQVGNASSYTGGWLGGISYGTDDTSEGYIAGAYTPNSSSGYFFFGGPSSAATMYMKGGNVGIGTSSPSYKLDVAGTGRFTGAVTLTSTLSVAGAVTINNTLAVSGNVTVGGTLSVADVIEANKGINIYGTLTGYVSGTDSDTWSITDQGAATFGSDVTVQGTFGVGSAAEDYATIDNSGNAWFAGTLDVTGKTTLGDKLTISKNGMSVTGAAYFGGGTTYYFGSTGNIYANTLSAAATTIRSTLGVTGLATLSGGATIPSGKTFKIGDCTISWDSTNGALKFDKAIYSTSAVGSLGASSSSGSSGGTSYSRLDAWPATWDEETYGGYVLSAKLGYELKTDLSTANNNIAALQASTLTGTEAVDYYRLTWFTASGGNRNADIPTYTGKAFSSIEDVSGVFMADYKMVYDILGYVDAKAITAIKINGTEKTPTGGVVDLGTISANVDLTNVKSSILPSSDGIAPDANYVSYNIGGTDSARWNKVYSVLTDALSVKTAKIYNTDENANIAITDEDVEITAGGWIRLEGVVYIGSAADDNLAATRGWVEGKGYITSSALDGYVETSSLGDAAYRGVQAVAPTETSPLVTKDWTENKLSSYATTTALGNKVDKVSGKGLSTNDFTDTLLNKLNGIAAGAEVNVQSDWNVTDTSSDAYIKNKPTIPTKTSQLTNDSNFFSTTENDLMLDNGIISTMNDEQGVNIMPSYISATSSTGTDTFKVDSETGNTVIAGTLSVGGKLVATKATTLSGYGITDALQTGVWIDTGVEPSINKIGLMQNTGAYACFGWSTTYAMSFKTNSEGLQVKNVHAGEDSGWKTIIHSGNYTSYTYSQSTIDSKIANGSVADSTLWNGFKYYNAINDYGNDKPCFKLITIKIKTTYVNSVISFDVSGRAKGVAHVEVWPNGASTVESAAVSYVRITGNATFADKIRAYVIGNETDSSGAVTAKIIEVWYTKQSQTYDSVVVNNVHWGQGESAEVNCTAHASLPTTYESYKDATMGSIYGSITKLTTPRTIWGQSFDGTGNVDGQLQINQSQWLNGLVLNRTVENAGAGIKFCSQGKQIGFIGINGQRNIEFDTDGTYRMLINQSGNVTIGSSNLAGTSYKLYVAGAMYASGNTSIGGTLSVSGASTLHATEVQGALNCTGNASIYGSITITNGGLTCSNGAVSCKSLTVNGVAITGNGGGSFTGGTVSGKTIFGSQGSNYDTIYQVYVNGIAAFEDYIDAWGGIAGDGWEVMSTGEAYFQSVDTASDLTRKNILSNVAKFGVKDIAEAPVAYFTWNSGKDITTEHLGTIAQYWKMVAPECVRGEDGNMRMDYSTLGLVSSIINARAIVNHEDRIAALEAENKQLKERIAALEAA